MHARTHTLTHAHTLLTPSQVHSECQERVQKMCTLGDHRLSVLPPSVLQRSDTISKGMWEVSQSVCLSSCTSAYATVHLSVCLWLSSYTPICPPSVYGSH